MKQLVSRLRLDRIPAVLWVVLALGVFFSLLSARFSTIGNVLNVTTQGAVLLILALGATITILTEGIDLSLGSVLSLSGVIAVLMLQRGVPGVPAMLIGVVGGALCGAVNGFLISVTGVPPFIATLGMQGVAGGAALILTDSGAIYAESPVLKFFGRGEIFFVPTPAVVAAVVFAIMYVVVNHTPFGRYVFALGGNEEGAELSGVNTVLWKFLVYVLSGALGGVAGVTMAARLNAANPIVGVMWEFDAIAATILGGTSFEMGRGSINGTVLGVALIASLRNGLNMIGMPMAWQAATVGIIIISAIIVDVTLVSPD